MSSRFFSISRAAPILRIVIAVLIASISTDAGGADGWQGRLTRVGGWRPAPALDVDWPAARARGAELEQARARQAVMVEGTLFTGRAPRTVASARAVAGAPPGVLGRLLFPGAVDAERRAALAAVAADLETLADRVQRDVASAHAWASALEVDPAATPAALASARSRLAPLQARGAIVAELASGAADALRLRAGGGWDRARLLWRTLTWRDGPTMLARLEARLAEWDAARLPEVLGAELTYLRGAVQAGHLPTSSTEPAYLSRGAGGLALEDTTAGREIELTDELTTRARALGSARAAFDFVRSGTKLDWYYGCLKGTQETLRELRGNDADLSALLIALLRAQGTPARYVRGTVELPVGRLAALLGLLDRDGAAALDAGAEPALDDAGRQRVFAALGAAGIPFEPVTTAGRIAAARFLHVWVEAYLPYADYRGAGTSEEGRQWLPLDPAFPGVARYAATPPTVDALQGMGVDAEALVTSYLAEGAGTQPLAFVRTRATGWLSAARPDLGYAQVLRTVEQRPEPLPLLPGTLPYVVRSVHDELPFLPEDAKHRVRIAVQDESGVAMEALLPMHDVLGKRTLLGFEPASDADALAVAAAGGLYQVAAAAVQVVPVLRIGGVVRARGTRSVALGAPAAWALDLLLPNGATRTISNTVVAGNLIAIGLGGPVNGYRSEADPATADGRASRVLYGAAADYANAWTAGEEELARFLQVVPIRPTANLVLVENALEVDEVLGVRRRIVWKGLQADADHRSMTPIELLPGRGRALLRLSGLEGSYQESRALRTATGEEAVSAVTIIQEAHRTGVPVLSLTPATAPGRLAALATTAEVRREVEDQLARGREVVIPAVDLVVRDWHGTGFIVRDLATDEGGYFLSGIISGGQTVVSPAFWQDQALLAALENPNAPEATSDRSRVARIMKIASTDLQRTIVGVRAPEPLTVRVTTAEGIPVWGAPVTFRNVGTSVPRLIDPSGQDLPGAIIRTTTDRKGFARALVEPDPVIAHELIVERAVPHDRLVGASEVMAETSNGTVTIAVPTPFRTLADPDVPAKLESACDAAAVVCGTVDFDVGMELGTSLWVRALDRFGNSVANARIAWATPPADGVFADPDAAASGVRMLNPLDPGQAPVFVGATDTQGEAFVDFIPARAGEVAAVGALQGLTATYHLRVREPRAEQFVFRMRWSAHGENGIYRTMFAAPVGGQVFQWTGGGWHALSGQPEGQVASVRVDMDVYDRSSGRDVWMRGQSVSPHVVTDLGPYSWFDDQTTAAFWPAYEVVDGRQINRFQATVEKVDGKSIACGERYVLDSQSRRATIDSFSFSAGFTERALDDLGASSGDDVGIGFRIGNPASRDIFVRIVEEPLVTGEPLVVLPSPALVPRHPADATLLRIPANLVSTLRLWLQASHGGKVRAELFGSNPQIGVDALEALYETRTVTIPPADAAILSVPSQVSPSIDVLVFNPTAIATIAGHETSDDETEPVVMHDAPLDFRVRGDGLAEVLVSGQVVAAASVSADRTGGLLLNPVPVDGRAPIFGVDGRLRAMIPPADPTVTEVLVRFRSILGHVEQRSVPLKTVVWNAGALPIGHTFVKGVSVVDGHLTHQVADIGVRGRGPALAFGRTYSSRAGEPGPLGEGWTHTFRSSVTKSTSGGRTRWLLVGGEGTGQVFDCTDAAAGCRSQRGFHGNLAPGANQVLYTARSGTRYLYAQADPDARDRYWLSSITDPAGRSLTLEYADGGAEGKVVRIFEAGNRRALQLSYGHVQGASRKRLLSVQLMGNDSPQAGAAAQLRPIDDDGACVVFGYEPENGNLSSASLHGAGCNTSNLPRRTEAYTYQVGGVGVRDNLRTLTDPNGRTTRYEFYGPSDPFPGEITAGDSTVLQRVIVGDKPERVRAVIEEAPGGTTRFEYALSPQPSTTFGELRALYRTTVTPARGGSAATVYRFDGYGATAREERGAVVRETRWDPIHIRPTEEKDPRGRRVTMTYDAAGNLVERRTATTVLGDPTRAPSTDALVDGDGNPIGEVVERWAYDPATGGETCRVDAEGRVRTTVWAEGLATEIHEKATPVGVDQLGSASACADLAAQVVSAEDARVVHNAYCGVNGACTAPGAQHGDLVETTEGPRWAGAGTYGTRRSTVTSFDLLGYAIAESLELGSGALQTTRHFDARGRKDLETDNLGHRLVQHFDALDRVDWSHRVNRVGTSGPSPGEYRTFAYYPAGQVRVATVGTETAPASILTRTIALDGLNLPETVTEDLGTGERLVTVEHHDASGNVRQVVDRRGVAREIAYDDLDRPIGMTLAIDDQARFVAAGGDAAGFVPGKQLVAYTYDAAGNRTSETDVHGHRTEYRLDPLYRVVRELAPQVPGATLATSSASYVTQRRFDRVGNKLRETDGNGHTTRWSYDVANRVIETIDAAGRFEHRSYDGLGKVMEETRGAGATVLLTRTSAGYDGLGRTLGSSETAADLDGASLSYQTAFAYDDAEHAVEVRDRRGAVTRRLLDDLDRVFEETVDTTGRLLGRTAPASAYAAVQATTRYEYDAASQRTAVADPLGRRTEELVDGLGRLRVRRLPMGVTEEASYDGDGRAIWRKDRRGVELRFRFDPAGRETEQRLVEARSAGGAELPIVRRQYDDRSAIDGTVKVTEVDALAHSTVHVLDALHREVRTQDAAGGVILSAYDAKDRRAQRDRKGNETWTDTDEVGRPLSLRDVGARGGARWRQSWSYDDAARTETWTSRSGVVTVTMRDALGRVRRTARGTAPLLARVMTSYDGNGNVVRVEDPNAHVTTSAWDGANRKRSETRGSGSADAATTTFTYDVVGNRLQTKGPRGTWAFDVEDTYDDLNRSVRTRVPTGDAASPYAVTSRAFDGVGNKLCERRPLAGDLLGDSAAGRTVVQLAADVCGGEGALVQGTRYSYDELSKVTSVVDALGGEHTFVYDAVRNLVAKQDARGNLTTFGYDALNRRTDEWQHLDAHARLRGRGDVPDASTEGPASPANETGALHWNVRFVDDQGREERTDPRGVTVTHAVGVLDRLESIVYPDDPGLRPAYPYPLSTAYAYDGDGDLAAITELKRIDPGTVASTATTREHDGLGRLHRETRDGKAVVYEYDLKGNRKKVTDPDEVATGYDYDALDRLLTVTTPAGVATYRYWADGLLQGASLPSGLEEARCYDPAGRVSAIVTARGAIATTCPDVAALVSRFDYAYDANGNRAQQRERRTDPASSSIRSAEETRYGYDALDRLVGVAYPDRTVVYQLDAVGNRTGERVVPAPNALELTVASYRSAATGLTSDLVATFNRADWLVSQTDVVDPSRTATFGYDLAGNLTDKVKAGAVRQLRWSFRNTLTVVLQGTGDGAPAEVGRYDYDADGQRVSRRTTSEQVEYVLDDRHVLQEASGAAGHPSYRRYHYGSGPLLVEDGGTRRFISTDALGSTTDLTTTGATVASMRKYDAWGQYRNDTAPLASEPKLGFTGHQYDPETGLVYARARYYDPEMGRFLSRDSVEGTIGDAPSLHRFMYVRGNPLRYTDPTGHCAVNKDGTVNCLAPAMAMQRQFASRMSAAWAAGNYGKAAYNLLLATANTVSVGVGAAAQLVVGTAYNAGYDASAGFSTGDYHRALRGSTELLMVAGGEHVMKGAQWVEETAAPAVKKVVTQAAEDLTTKLAPEVAGAERAAVTEAVEQATKPGTAQAPAAEVGTPTSGAATSEEEAAAGYVYRGVHAEHPALPEAQRGRVVPGNPEGTVTAKEHNAGSVAAESPYTSWTHEPRIAVENATKSGPGGVVLRLPVGAPPEGATWRWEWSPDRYGESEVLLKGVREGAKVLRPEEVPTVVTSETGK